MNTISVTVADQMAREGCVSYWEATPGRKLPVLPAEYRWVVFATHGTGVGSATLAGLTPRARALVREGKVRRLIAAGIDPRIAEVAASACYGMEEAVAQEALRLVGPAATNGRFEGCSRAALDRWARHPRRPGEEKHPLSFRRRAAAAEMALRAFERARRSDQGRSWIALHVQAWEAEVAYRKRLAADPLVWTTSSR